MKIIAQKIDPLCVRVFGCRNPRRVRGTVIILVVAMLALLAVLGTAYIVSARTDRSSARANSESVNLDLASDGVMATVRQTLFDASMAASSGNVLAIPDNWKPNTGYLIGDFILGGDYRVYRCSTAHTSDVATNGPPPVTMTNWALTTLTDVPQPIAARWYDYPEKQTTANWATQFDRSQRDLAVPSQAWLSKNLSPIAASSDYSLFTKDMFNPSVPGTALAYSANPPTVGLVPVVDPLAGTPVLDSQWNLLTVNSGNGVRYRYAVRILDSSARANLNTGQVWAGATPYADAAGTYLTSVQLGNTSIYLAGANDDLNNVHVATNANGVHGRGPSAGAFTLAGWQNRLLGYENFGINPAVAAFTLPQGEFFDLSDELELVYYGTRGSDYTPRVAVSSAPKLFGTTLLKGTANRAYYTTYSFDRNWSSFSTNRFVITGVASEPTYQRQVPLTRDVYGSVVPANTYVVAVRNGLSLANMMSSVGYPDSECIAVMLNFLAQSRPGRGGTSLTFNGAGIGALFVAGPTAAENTVINITIPTNPIANRTYLAYSAQPFLNEVAIRVNHDGTSATQLDCAVELFNPYTTAIDLTGWQLKIGGTVLWHTFGAVSIPAGGYLVITHANLIALGTIASGSLGTIPASLTVTLDRPYFTTIANYMTVDRVSYDFATSAFYPAALTATPVNVSRERPNTVGATSTAPQPAIGAADKWMCVSSLLSDYTDSAAHSLGVINVATGTTITNFGVRLVDRFYDTGADAWPGGATASDALVRSNPGDLQGYARLCNVLDNGNPIPITEQLGDGSLMPTKVTSQSAQEARVRFDVLADPRAQRLFMSVAMADRSSDGFDQIGFGSADSTDEARIPGRINVNTASPQVLRAVFANFTSTSTVLDAWVANIMAYRDRVAVSSLAAPYNAATPAGDYSNTTNYPGLGIRSLSELLIPLGSADGTVTLSGSRTVPASGKSILSVTAPDQTWVKAYGACTVRSDTFIVYGYLEAIKANPNLATTHNNGSQWYGTTTDDPRNITFDNIRLAKRRFVSIVDRSYSNYPRGNANFVLPRIVAIKDMPQ